MVQAPADFGRFGGDLLVGNFGDGKINVFDPSTGKLLGQIQDASGKAITIDGLWGLAFGNGGQAGPTNELFFSSGPEHEAHGLFGGLTAGGSPGIATIADANLISIGITAEAGRNDTVSGVLGKFIDQNHRAKASDFTVTIDWGDGSPPSLGTVKSIGWGLFAVSGTHTFATPRKHAITISVEDIGGSTTTIDSWVFVRRH